MNMMSDITRNVMVMVGSVLLSAVVMVLVAIALYYIIKSQFTPDKIVNFFFN